MSLPGFRRYGVELCQFLKFSYLLVHYVDRIIRAANANGLSWEMIVEATRLGTLLLARSYVGLVNLMPVIFVHNI